MNNQSCIICLQRSNIKMCNGNPICSNCFEEQKKLDSIFSKSKRKLHPEYSEIIKDKLYLGNADFARDINCLNSLNITHILSIGYQLDEYNSNFIYHYVDLQDLEEDSLLPYIKECIEYIDKGKVVFVHCNAGVSRSPSIVIAYLIINKKMSFDEAYEYIKSKRNCIMPNKTFKKELIHLKDNYLIY